MLTKTDASYNQLAFSLEILKLLAEKPRRREELTDVLSEFLERHGKSTDSTDVKQKLTRTIRKLRDCGIEIKSNTHSPYELAESNFPVILSTQQREALALAVYILSDMGFSTQASQIQRIGNLKQSDIPEFVKVNFSPPVDYSDNNVDTIVHQLQERFHSQCRYTIRYCSKKEARIWDIDRSELRLHNGVLYLFAFIPDWRSYRFDDWHNIDQNHIFRIDRIESVGAASNTRWMSCNFPTLKVHTRFLGQLATYQPRRKDEVVIHRDNENKFVDIETTIDYWFWFRQRILQYGANAQIISPEILRQEIKKEHQKAHENSTNNP